MRELLVHLFMQYTNQRNAMSFFKISAAIWLLFVGSTVVTINLYALLYVDYILATLAVLLVLSFFWGVAFRMKLIRRYKKDALVLFTGSYVIIEKFFLPGFIWSFQLLFIALSVWNFDILPLAFFWLLFSFRAFLTFIESPVFGDHDKLMITNLSEDDKVLLSDVKFSRIFLNYYYAEFLGKKRIIVPKKEFRKNINSRLKSPPTSPRLQE